MPYLFEQHPSKGELAYSSVRLVAAGKIVDSQCVWVPVPGRTDRVIEVHIPRKGDSKRPMGMFLRVASLVQTPAGSVLPTPGLPYVVCRLNASQAAQVMSNDLPPELMTTMDGAATAAGWRPMPDGIASAPAEILVDPAGFFKPKDKAVP